MPILKTVIAGPLRQQILYTNIRINDDDNLETMRKKDEIRRQSDYWIRVKHRALAASILTNFDESAFWCTLTFSDEKLPDRREDVARRFGYFRTLLKRDGKIIRYIKCMEHRHGIGRWHMHCIISGCSASDIKKAWIYGHAQCKPLDPERVVRHIRPNGQTSEGLAQYICKEIPDRIGQRIYQTSTREAKLERAEVVIQYVPSEYMLEAPEDCKVIYKSTIAINAYGSSEVLEYLIPSGKGL